MKDTNDNWFTRTMDWAKDKLGMHREPVQVVRNHSNNGVAVDNVPLSKQHQKERDAKGLAEQQQLRSAAVNDRSMHSIGQRDATLYMEARELWSRNLELQGKIDNGNATPKDTKEYGLNSENARQNMAALSRHYLTAEYGDSAYNRGFKEGTEHYAANKQQREVEVVKLSNMTEKQLVAREHDRQYGGR